MDLRISGFSTALYSTYWLIEPLDLLLDCGDGAASTLQQKGRKVKTIACSHADRDHLTGLFQFLQLNSSEGTPRILYPSDCGSFPAVQKFTEQFDRPPAGHAQWEGIEGGTIVELRSGCKLEAFPNRHIEGAGQTKSLSYSIIEDKRKLKKEFNRLTGAEIAEAKETLGDSAVLDTVHTNILTYAADTPIEGPEFWREPEILIHESTFLDRETATSRSQDTRHSVLGEVIEMACRIKNLKSLILGHFSTRYENEEIRAAIVAHAEIHRPNYTIHAVLPGQFVKNLRGIEPIWQPS